MRCMETVAVEEMGAAEALHAFGDLRRARDCAERDLLRLAAHFADLYNVDTDAPNRHTLPGTERSIEVAGDGAPRILEFAIAEAAAELGTTSHSTKRLIGDALDLRHRLPKLWARVRVEAVPAWRARKVAQATRHLTAVQARYVDEEIHEVADGRLPYRQFVANLEAAVIAADPETAAARERAAAAQTFAKVGQSNQHGTKTLYVKTSAAAMARIDATIAYLADALAYFGDTSNEDTRRTTAVLLLANPTEAVTLLQALATARTGAGADTGTEPGTPTERHPDQHGTTGPGRPRRDEDETPLPDPDPDRDADHSARAHDTDGHRGSPGAGERRKCPAPQGESAALGHDPASDPPEPGRSRDPGGGAPRGTELDRAATPFDPTALSPCPCRGGSYTYDPRRLLPKVTLYVHVHEETLGNGGHGVARWEGEGPITPAYIRDFLGPACHVDIKPVIDLARQAPAAGYETPARLREAVHLRSPSDVFPFAPNVGREKQLDHTVPYTRPHDRDDQHDQTRLDNLGPMTGYHHRVKTHGGWQVVQPFNGIFLWKAPHGSVYLVDNSGTRQLHRPTLNLTLDHQDSGGQGSAETTGSPMIDHFWTTLLTHAA